VLKERQSIQVGLAKVYAALAPIMQFYFYRIDRKSNGHKMVKSIFTLLLHKEKLGLLEGLVLEVLEERLWHNIT
jgi:hypothetical protein